MTKEKIAIIGGGISGLSLALALSHPDNGFDITLFEKKKRLGGHSRTLTLKDSVSKKSVAVDSGFVVFNEKNYPELTKLFGYLDIATQASKMTFCYHHADKQYNFTSDRFFQDKATLFNLQHYALLFEIFFFQRLARRTWQDIDKKLSLQKWLDQIHASEHLRRRYLYPLGAAIWSMPIGDINQYPARYFAQFFFNHGLFTVNDQPQWRTIVGGAKIYVEKIKKYISSFGGKIINNDGVMELNKKEKWLITTESGNVALYDKVVLACHSDQALHILKKTDHPAKQFLTMIKYKSSDVFTHRRPDYMPNKRSVYACWNFFERHGKTTMSYWMNQLQSLKTSDDFFVTLNPASIIKQYDDHTVMQHPQYNLLSGVAQKNIKHLQGVDDIFFCGAYLGYGFHEDGIKSASDILPYFHAKKPWQK
ncbi:MAG: NAD(P)/FAD-dependent oxidoreductase [Alphaproteobacteria bacterium]